MISEEELKYLLDAFAASTIDGIAYDTDGDSGAIIAAFAELRAERDAALSMAGTLRLALNKAYAFVLSICSGRTGSMGSLDNVFLPQVDRQFAEELLSTIQSALRKEENDPA